MVYSRPSYIKGNNLDRQGVYSYPMNVIKNEKVRTSYKSLQRPLQKVVTISHCVKEMRTQVLLPKIKRRAKKGYGN